MPAPPVEVHIKRKATDDPVDLLHIQNEVNGIRQIRQYVFKRQRTSPPNLEDKTRPLPSFTSNQMSPGNHVSQLQPPTKIQMQAFGQSMRRSEEASNGMVSLTGIAEATSDHGGGIGSSETPATSGRLEQRRFHISRSSTPQKPAGMLSSRGRGVGGIPTVFIERRRPKELASIIPQVAVPKTDNLPSQQNLVQEVLTYNSTAQPPSSSRSAEQHSKPPLNTSRSPSGVTLPRNADSTKLTAEIQAYVMEDIGRRLAESSETVVVTKPTPFIRARQVSRFKPKVQAFRHRERHPERAKPTDTNSDAKQDEAMTDAIDADTNESGYVMDTYIRMPAEMFVLQEQKNVGVLVLDSQPDIDEFYNGESDSDSEIYDEEEDENAENHPSTEYPEDEVDSDDEYGRNPYKLYRNRNASDNEEFDEDDVTYSDEEEAKPAWARRPWMTNKASGEDHEADDDDD